MAKRIVPSPPERMMPTDEHHAWRKEMIVQIVDELWPAIWDKVPVSTSEHMLEEFDLALKLIKRRRQQYIGNGPPRGRGGQLRWDETQYKILLLMEEQKQEEGLTGGELVAWLCEYFGISDDKKLYKRLREAREIVARE